MKPCETPLRACQLETSLDEIKSTVTDIHKRLFIGNGTPAITTEVDRLKIAMAALQATKNRRVEFWLSLAALTLSGIVAAVAVAKIH